MSEFKHIKFFHSHTHSEELTEIAYQLKRIADSLDAFVSNSEEVKK